MEHYEEKYAPEDIMTIQPLGAGQEVGRSCHFLQYKGKKILLDMGIHPGINGVGGLPYMDEIDPHEIDILLITHFHLDHCGALPWFLSKTSFKGKVYMTHATKAIYRWLLSDYIKVSNVSNNSEGSLFTEMDVDKSLERIETLDFHERKQVNGITFWCYHAGHVLGACMFMIEIAGVRVLYTGDFSRVEDRHLHSAEVPEVKADVLICESTFGVRLLEKQEDREKRFTNKVHEIIQRGGRVLIPVFALGRAQELLLILDEYWQQHPELHDVPIYYASSLAKKCMQVYKTYTNAMNEKIRKQINIRNPFQFKHISNLKGIDSFDDGTVSVVMASPGMMQSGLSRDLFERWCDDSRNGVIIAGYTVDGTLAKHILTEPPFITTQFGARVPLKMSVDLISFAAHADYRQISVFIREMRPPQVVLVHGEANEMGKLKKKLMDQYEDDPEGQIAVYTPKNTDKLNFYFRGEKLAKIIGGLAEESPLANKELSGVLIKRNFSYQIMSPEDIAKHTDLTVSDIVQRQAIRFTSSIEALQYYMLQLTEDVRIIEHKTVDGDLCMGLKVFGKIKLIKVSTPGSASHNVLIIEWSAGPVADMLADACLAITLRVDALSGQSQQHTPQEYGNMSDPKVLEKKQNAKFQQRLASLLEMQYGDVTRDSATKWRVEVADKVFIKINLETLEVECEEDNSMEQLVGETVRRLHTAVMPITKLKKIKAKAKEDSAHYRRANAPDMDESMEESHDSMDTGLR